MVMFCFSVAAFYPLPRCLFYWTRRFHCGRVKLVSPCSSVKTKARTFSFDVASPMDSDVAPPYTSIHTQAYCFLIPADEYRRFVLPINLPSRLIRTLPCFSASRFYQGFV